MGIKQRLWWYWGVAQGSVHSSTIRTCTDFFYNESGETLAQVAQRGGRCPIPGNTQGQVGWGPEQPDLVEDVSACCRGVGLDDCQRSLPTIL